ncbi:hypothetical protein tinsulaeT_07870 [Thalassotalea insulae]|uniref:YfcL protein n=1 Tax=Thalassotalea insulae TaxID=2056778 RepID=A0ABQ6GS37_9GAMM|nr:YfcL family protein [Thalassotalea insulae]GLX77447.1 hypothetical protein tinsulaeT_07870 [Thalassotalea insulae]
MNLSTLAELYQYFDDLVLQDCSNDDLFASSYIKGFIALAATEFGDESQPLSKALAAVVSEKLTEARSELSPEDKVIVNNYWSGINPLFCY